MVEAGPLAILAGASLAAWLYLTFLHGRFWRADQWLEEGEAAEEDREWPEVVAVVPARNEAAVIERCLGSLLGQDYPGPFSIVLVDDHSDDGTGDLARALADGAGSGSRLRVQPAEDMPPGWVGKMWAVHNGIEAARGERPAYWLLTDADVEHSPGNLRRLVLAAEAGRLDLVSLMVLLHCRGGWERLLIPAFVYFFQKLYPFPRVNAPRSRVAGAAGGCMLVRAASLEKAGGVAAIRGEIIDDCALGALLKRRGPVWLGLTVSERSIRPYEGLGDIWGMVARSAYTQLGYSPLLLAGTVLGLALLYLVPPGAALVGAWTGARLAAVLGAAAWALMSTTFWPTLRLYGRSPLLAPLLPLAGMLYLGMTLDSARLHWQGLGGRWKGRDLARKA